MKKTLTLIHMTRALALMERMDQPDTQLELVATYNATASQLIQARKNTEVMDGLIAQAAEITPDSAQEILGDFFEQFTAYNRTLAACFGRVTGVALPEATPETSSSNS